MMMKVILSIPLLFLLLSVAAFSQESKCGELTVTGPSAFVQPGETQRFEARLTPEIDPSKYKVKWTVENGQIVFGQGTLVLQALGNDDGTTIRATATVTGLGECDSSASDDGVVCDCVEPILIDEFGELPHDELQLRIEKMFDELHSDPTASAYIVSYGPAKKVARFQESVREFIPLRDGPDKLVLVTSEIEDELRVRIWIVPAGADASQIN